MAAVTICSDFGGPKNKVWQFPLFPHLFAIKWWDWMPWSLFTECWFFFSFFFFECWVLSQLFHSPLSLSSRGSLVLCFLNWTINWFIRIWANKDFIDRSDDREEEKSRTKAKEWQEIHYFSSLSPCFVFCF